MLVDDEAGDFVEFDVGALRASEEQVEGLQGGEVFAVHQDAFGLADNVAAG